MDSVISTALEELCSSPSTGLSLRNLWPKLLPSLTAAGLDLSSGVKQAVWSNLLKNPNLRFPRPQTNASSSSSSRSCSGFIHNTDPSIQSVQAAESMDFMIVVEEHLRNCFLGLYDLNARDGFKGISVQQRRALERVAIARTNGITQSQLAKEFGVEGNEIFYIVRNLECQGLIVRQSTIVKTKGTSNEGELENRSAVTTNMLYLYRYAKHLGSQQRLEITKEDKSLESLVNANIPAACGDDTTRKCVKEDVLIKDFLPALKAICDKLEEADGKVLVVKDIKQDLGYQKTSGHRAWRNICQKLKDAHVVEEFRAKVNNKVVPCLRLLKGFSPKSFGAKAFGCGNDDVDSEPPTNVGKRGQFNDQVVELPIEHQIYDMIDAEGSKGLTIIEACRRLGISNKKYYNRLLNMFSRCGMHLRAEGHKRGTVYRVWTSGNFSSDLSNVTPSKLEDAFNGASSPQVDKAAFHENLVLTIPKLGPSTPKGDVATSGKIKNWITEMEHSHSFSGVSDCNSLPLLRTNSLELVPELNDTAPEPVLDLVNVATEVNVAPSEMPLSASSKFKFESDQRYPCLSLNAVGGQREQKTLERLQEEKFIIRADLQRWLESFEKDKRTTMDSKTLIRMLNKLQEQGLCKCIKVSVPVVTNCGRSRMKEVVLHPSVQNLPPELLGQIHDKLRSFEMQCRGHGLSRFKEDQSLPVLNGIRKNRKVVTSDTAAVKSEAMRANGFILAKMIRAKLLYSFLWNYMSSFPGWDDALSSGKHGYDIKNPHSTCKLFGLDAAIKAIPLELFLQVVGSTKKYDDLVEKCRSGLLLSNLPIQEYKSLMDTQATGRLSGIIDILRRLKLIRLVTDGNPEGEDNVSLATFRHAMELKPYIEEPRTIFAPSGGCSSFDLRPQIRHDFVLLNREAVDDYWRTLEYCYAAADPTAALHAFPGSAVHEVFLFRSWASVRVMTAEQHAELNKRIVKEDPSKKLSLKECEKIARDLGLTLQQVLRVYNDKRRYKHPNRSGGVLNPDGNEIQPLNTNHDSSSRKRKRSSEEKSSDRINALVRKFGKQKLATSSVAGNKFEEEQHHLISSLGEQETDLQVDLEHEHIDHMEMPGPSEDDNYSFLSRCASSGKPTRQKKFSWTEIADRKLIIQYVRHRATLGVNFHRTGWASLPDLPAPPGPCRRRMALLNSNVKFRKSVMKLCNLLSERYAKYLGRSQKRLLNQENHRLMVEGVISKNRSGDFSDDFEHIRESDHNVQWDDFDDENIKVAFDDVLQHKRLAKLEDSREDEFVAGDLSDLNVDTERHDPQESELLLSSTLSKDIQDHGETQCKEFRWRAQSYHLPQKFIKCFSEGKSIGKQARESLAVCSAIELLKLVFLNTSKAAEVPHILAETLRRYSEHDLFAAFSYLREKKIMIGGSSGNTFALSQQFLHNISLSPFPPNTGKRAAEFAGWLNAREKVLMEEGIELTADLECGDIFYLFALVSSGELSVTPCMPDEGIGAAEDLRGSKRKADDAESSIDDERKKLKSSVSTDGEIISRREKGFPGLMVSLSRETLSEANAMDFLKEGNCCLDAPSFVENVQYNTSVSREISSSSSHSGQLKEELNFRSVIPKAGLPNDSLWEAMASYAENLTSRSSDKKQVSPLYPEHFRTVYTAIQKAGDQGLSVEQVSGVIDVQGKEIPWIMVKVLETFGQALKVNTYNSVHVVDALYHSKYFLTSMAGSNQELKPAPSTKSQAVNDDGHLTIKQSNGASSQRKLNMKTDNVHQVTILNLMEEVSQSSSEIQAGSNIEECTQGNVVFVAGDPHGKLDELSFNAHVSMPILPWINGDGTINKIVYKGLVRRVLGIVMQNPGILEDDIIRRMDVLKPQSCRKLLELMILDNHLIVRKMHQTTSCCPPEILGGLLRSSFRTTKSIWREHFFANPLSISML